MARRAIIARLKETAMDLNGAQRSNIPLRALAAAGALVFLLAACGEKSPPPPKPWPKRQLLPLGGIGAGKYPDPADYQRRLEGC